MAHRAPFAFEPGEIDYADDIHRFLHGSPAIPALYAAESGYDLINEVGVERIRAKSLHQTARLIGLADDRGWRVNSPRDPDRRGGTVIMDVPHAGPIVQWLAARDVLVDYRPGAGIRVGPHFYNTDEELLRLCDEISDALAERVWESQTGHGTGY
jgi:kynureninase